MSSVKYPVILSFDVGIIHLSYCLMTKKMFAKPDGTQYLDWDIIDWNNIDMTQRNEMKCECGAKASLTNNINGETKYYCKKHGKKIDVEIQPFEELFTSINKLEKYNKCNDCDKKATYRSNESCFCTVHSKQKYKNMVKSNELKDFKIKSSKTLNFDDVKYSLMMILEGKPKLLEADYVVIENQPSFKNPRMKSIASTLYDYYLIRGIIDKKITKSNISMVKFMSPSNKLKLADEGDTKQLIKVKKEANEEGKDTKAYKLTKSLGIKYCTELVKHLPNWLTHFNSFKKKDDMADSFLQGAYFFTKNCLPPEEKRKSTNNDGQATYPEKNKVKRKKPTKDVESDIEV
jgi:hypothetical protein